MTTWNNASMIDNVSLWWSIAKFIILMFVSFILNIIVLFTCVLCNFLFVFLRLLFVFNFTSIKSCFVSINRDVMLFAIAFQRCRIFILVFFVDNCKFNRYHHYSLIISCFLYVIINSKFQSSIAHLFSIYSSFYNVYFYIIMM